jgi:hypothetical protein
MQQLAGIKEIKVVHGGIFQTIFNKWLMDAMVSQAEDLEFDAPEAAAYLTSLKQNPPTANTLDLAVEKIIEIHEELNDLVGEYPGSYYEETIEWPLNNIGEEPNLKPYVDQILSKLNDTRNQEDDNDNIDDEDDEFGWNTDYDEY